MSSWAPVLDQLEEVLPKMTMEQRLQAALALTHRLSELQASPPRQPQFLVHFAKIGSDSQPYYVDHRSVGPESTRKRHVNFPDGMQFLFDHLRYKIGEGGRGSGKSWSFARAAIIRAVLSPLRILCVREFQTSISESVHQLLEDQIEIMQLSAAFEVRQAAIYRKPWQAELDEGIGRGSEFFFYGVKTNTTKVKSAERINICWVEEAEKVSEMSWQILIPTIREPNSEIWISFNPDEENDPTYQRFVQNTPPDAVTREFNWNQNPWFPEVLRKEKDYLYKVDPEAAAHVWGGKCRQNASAQIFRGKYSVESFTVPVAADVPSGEMWDGPYFGADFGFSQDPATLVKLWIDSVHHILYIEHAIGGVGIELDDLPEMYDRIPESRSYVIRGDCSRPETISHVRNHGFRAEAAEKWSGSVEDGIAWLKAFEKIVIHPRCESVPAGLVQEARLYSYKVDRLTGDVLRDIADKHNHYWDAIRYACQPMIMAGTSLAVWSKL